MRRVGLRDVAARAGVSVKTVSNVVNNTGRVTPATRRRVQEAVEALGYRPNLSARNLRRGRTGVISLALPELAAPYFAELAEAFIRAAEPRSLTVLIDQTDGRLERERLTSEGRRLHESDGLVFSPLAMTAEDLARRTDDTPLVLLGEHAVGSPHDHVIVDNRAAAAQAVHHLFSLGRRRVAVIGAQHSGPRDTSELRLAGYRQALAETGVPYDPALVADVTWFHRADGARAMRRLLDLPEPPDAVFCFNDLLALGAIRCAHEQGLRVPDDIAVIGFDDIEEGRFSTPTLSTIAPDRRQIAETALDLLTRRIAAARRTGPDTTADAPDAAPRVVTVPHTLHARESTVGPRPPGVRRG